MKAAHLGETVLVDANLSSTENNESKRGADLSHADLSDANLTVTDEQLAECESLEGATMPDGTEHPEAMCRGQDLSTSASQHSTMNKRLVPSPGEWQCH